ncbi:MAG: hypothetical protein CYPHOPRED_005700 [Cyphobasidiales sp. Tagirdzhanova-0007]|nr:MAG: hypothetical protein CYPHOPRED_005700 [Cyphobasidiales sp. Tagirdzhanova-0007]
MRRGGSVCSSARLSFVRQASTASSSSLSANLRLIQQHTLKLVQSYDYPNYLNAFFYPQEARYDYLAIRAFNVELSNVADSVKSPQLGRLRFQWWREAVASLQHDKPLPHPTVQALHAAHRRRKLSTYHLNRLIEAREQNILSPSYDTISNLTTYAQSTSLSLLLLQLYLLTPAGCSKIENIPLSTIDHSLSHLATYICISQVIRSIPFFANKRILVLPRDIASAHGVVEEAVFRALPSSSQEKGLQRRSEDGGDADDAFQPVIQACEELVALAELERSKARWTLGLETSGDEEHAALAQGRTLSRLPKAISPVFLSAVPARSLLKQFVGTAGGNPFHPSIRVNANRNWKLPFQTWWASRTDQF